MRDRQLSSQVRVTNPRLSHLASADNDSEPRWHAVVAMVTTGLIYYALPPSLSLGPPWLPFAITVPLEALTMGFLWMGKEHWNKVSGFVVSGILTLFMSISVSLLVRGMLLHTENPGPLLRSALLLWGSNILIFAVWYWRLDAGGPNARDRNEAHTDGAFLFPQMMWDRTKETWSPQFVDYLFLAFNTATAFSPTDVPVLSRWAKILVMGQSLISLAIVVLLAARAVNIM